MSKIFQEAIADAKKLKEVAEETAKKAILESVTPKIREYIEDQLLENKEDSEEESEDSEEVNLNEDALKAMSKLLTGRNHSNEVKAALNSLSESDRKKMLSIANKINEKDDNYSSNKIDIKESTKRNNMKKEKFYEVDLRLLREQIEEEAAAHDISDMNVYEDSDVEEMDSLDEYDMPSDMDMMYEQDDDSESEIPLEDDMEMSEEEPSEDVGGGEGMIARDDVEREIQDLVDSLGLELGGGAPAGDAPDLGGLEDMEMSEEEPSEEEVELNEYFDIDPQMLREELANVKRMLGEGKMDHHFGGKGGSKAGVKNAFGGSGAKKAGYQKSFGGGAYGKDVFVTPPSTLKKLNEARKMLQKLSRMNRAQDEKLNKYRSAVHTLREQLEDLNLFNAKLLYVNKLLQNKSLNESQKRSVIKALDEAKSLGETKSLYKSLTESLASSGKTTLQESTRFGSSSRATTSSSQSKENVVGEVGRWQRLAGLK